MKITAPSIVLITYLLAFACNKIELPDPVDPKTAEVAVVDRFSEDFATMMIRDSANKLPGPGEAIDFDAEPFITRGLDPDGRSVQYYNFDVQPLASAPLYVLFREGESDPVEAQLNIIDAIPGDPGYSDFWHMIKVFVPSDYEANMVTSYEQIIDFGFDTERTNRIINCPIVPAGSEADLRYRDAESNELFSGWYKSKLIYYFTFEEKELVVNLPETGSPYVPISGILVTFNVNPGLPGGGPASGPVTEADSDQTHNVLETMPEDEDYSPLWSVDVYDNADFNNVNDWESATNATILATGVMHVNCPVVAVDPV